MEPPKSTVIVTPDGMVTVIPNGMKTKSVDVIVMGGPAPPQVAASSQSPFWVAVNEVASASWVNPNAPKIKIAKLIGPKNLKLNITCTAIAHTRCHNRMLQTT